MEIQDFGEKIGGAKKDLWKERGLSVDDLSYMNDAERIQLIKKDNIWKKPNYQEMVESGLPVRVAYFIKTIRDATPTKPIILLRNSDIELKQKEYIDFVSKLRDYVMNLKQEDDILTFYEKFLSNYIIRDKSSYYVRVSPEVSSAVDNKLLQASQISNFYNMDKEIRKKQFCYTDDEKVLSNFDIFVYDNDNVKLTIDYNNRTVIEVKEGLGKRFIYPKEDFADILTWKENTIFIIDLTTRNIIKNNLENIDAAEKFILENYKQQSNEKTNNSKNRKKKFIPEQLKYITRDGEDYRNNRNITGEDMLKTFQFKGGEFGNWLNENDRQQSLNYGYDALLDLSKALSISPTDISLDGKLSIAFGSRGSGDALAHYEPTREVINLTKMRGAGSLAHEWGHALDDIIGKKLGYSGFLTDNFRYSDSTSETIKNVVDAMKYKTVCNEESIKKQNEEYLKRVTRMKNLVNSFFPPEHLNEKQTELKDILIQNLIHNAETASNNFLEYFTKGTGNKDIDDLSNLRKETVGRVISKEDRKQIAQLQNYVCSSKKQIGKEQRVETDFYKNSIKFDEIYAKSGHDYWSTTIEMFARSFACYVSDKLGYKSDYLCGHANLAIGSIQNKNNEPEVIKAFPEGKERQIINEKIDKLIEFLKEKNILHDSKTQEIESDYDYDYA